MRTRQRRRSIAPLVILLALSGLLDAISLARVGQQTRTPRLWPGSVP